MLLRKNEWRLLSKRGYNIFHKTYLKHFHQFGGKYQVLMHI